jgi:hypothetical protein
MKAARFVGTSGRNYPNKWRNNPEELTQQSHGGNLKSLF